MTLLNADIYTSPELMTFNLERPIRHHPINTHEHPAPPNPPINLDRPVKPPSVTKDLPDINLDRPVRSQMAMTDQPDLLQHPVDHHSLINLERPVRPPAAHALLNLDQPVLPPAGSTNTTAISLEPPVPPFLNLERPVISTPNLDRPGRNRPPFSFDFPIRQPASSQDVQNLNLDRPPRR